MRQLNSEVSHRIPDFFFPDTQNVVVSSYHVNIPALIYYCYFILNGIWNNTKLSCNSWPYYYLVFSIVHLFRTVWHHLLINEQWTTKHFLAFRFPLADEIMGILYSGFIISKAWGDMENYLSSGNQLGNGTESSSVSLRLLVGLR